MKEWPGMPIRTVSKLTAERTVKADRAAVPGISDAVRGNPVYRGASSLCGTSWYPVSFEYDNPGDALDRCREIEQEIEKARAAETQRRAEIESRYGR